MLQDTHNRSIGYLRLSLTTACQMRCLYCRPATWANPHNENRLTPSEIEALVRHLAQRHGLRKVRLTGGDPTSRPDLTQIIKRIAAIPGIDDLAMTTNGLTLAQRATEYADAGLKRVNVSLDTLDPARFAALTGVDALDRVLAGIDAAQAAGLWPIKLNTVVVRSQNESALPELVRFAAARGLEVRFIELMPMGPLADQWAQRYVPEHRMRQMLEPHLNHWEALAQGHDAARRYRVRLHDGREAVIGFITPMSCNFCAACNRIRVAADGTLYPCLMDRPQGTLLPAFRPRFDADRLDELLRDGLAGKRREHPHNGFVTMTAIGG
ncbi:MAG TPA: GTP 3',8-cyclase MoaA [Phycisphaeraceae bacterium]